MTHNPFQNLITFADYFNTNENCHEYLRWIRWNDDKPICPYCNRKGAYIFVNGFTYKCINKKCKRKFSGLVGTFMEDSKVPLQLWLLAMYFWITRKQKISSIELASMLGVTQTTAWRMAERLKNNENDFVFRRIKHNILLGKNYFPEASKPQKPISKPSFFKRLFNKIFST